MESNDAVNVLLVDDRPENLLALEAILEDLEVEVHTASSGEEALGMVLQHPYALILMDVQMPGMDGFETTNLIKGRKETASIPIIFVTAINKEERYVYQGYTSGAVDYLSKPLDNDIVCSKVSVFADLYRQKREVERSRAALEAAQEELIQASKLESIGRLASSVAHEVKNPLQIQRMGLSFLIEKFPDLSDDICREMLGEMDHAITRADNIIQGLVEYSSFRGAAVEDTNLNELLTKVLDLSKIALQSGKVEVETDFQDELPSCEVDPPKIMQVIDNLITNAMQAMPEGGRLHIRTSTIEPEDASGLRMIRTEIQDTGGGIPEDILGRVCDPFFTTRDDEKQVGLGLSICLGIINMHQGTLRLENRNGGTCAVLELPV